MTKIIEHIPDKKNAHFFGILSIVVLISNTIIPPLLPFLLRVCGSFPGVLLLFSAVTALVFPLVFFKKNHKEGAV